MLERAHRVGRMMTKSRPEQHPDGHVLAVAHAGVIFAVERIIGAEWERLANLGGRWLEHANGTWTIGNRIHLLIDETIPDQI